MAKIDAGATKKATTKATAMSKPVDALYEVPGAPAKALGGNTRGVAGGKNANKITNLGGGKSSAPRGTRSFGAVANGKAGSRAK